MVHPRVVADKVFDEKILREHAINTLPLKVGRKNYRVGRMSYGDWFLEPYEKKFPLGRGERVPFRNGTLWLEKTENGLIINQLLKEILP